MRFGLDRRRRIDATPLTPGERLVRRTGLGLAVFTLALIAILMTAVGLVTAAATVEAANQSVDRNLRAAAENMLLTLRTSQTPSPSPLPTATASPEDSGDDDDDDEEGDSSGSGGGNSGPGGGGDDDDDRTPRPTRRPTATSVPTARPAASPSPAPSVTPGPGEGELGSSDTFFLVLDDNGTVRVNPQNVSLAALPDESAIAAAMRSGSPDWRTVRIEGNNVRLLTQPVGGEDDVSRGVLQTGFVLQFQEEQTAQVVRTIVVATLVGLLGAALVTLFVTRRAMAPIREAFEAERRFVAAASHELRTPVAVVRASAEILQREDLVKPDGKPLVQDVVAESDRLGRLVGDLLALASAEAGQISIDPTHFDARSLVDAVVDRVSKLAQDRGVTVVAVHERGNGRPASVLNVEADRERMLQLLTILIDNAIDHSPPNGVVRVLARPGIGGDHGRAVIEVLDQGPGVPLEERDRIFEPFAKVGGRRRSTGSTGLGLAIARILAERQDATLAVRDAPGGGACFSVSLPRRAA
jgi:signal transduction histidine kinase